LGAPAGWEVAVEIQAGRVARSRHRKSVKIFDDALVQKAIPRNSRFDTEWSNRDHHAGFGWVFNPRTIGIDNAHRTNRSIAVHVLDV
jgi:hypothetical protein